MARLLLQPVDGAARPIRPSPFHRWKAQFIAPHHRAKSRLSGEPGIGKSRLVRVLRERLAGEPHSRIELRCSQMHQNSALYPLIDHYQRLLQFSVDDTREGKIGKLESALEQAGLVLAETVPLFASLLSLPLPDRYAPLQFSPERQKQKTYEASLTWLRAEATRQPVLFVVEDLHGIDPSTLDLLGLLVDGAQHDRILGLFTCRPEFTPPWPLHAHLSVISLSRLDQGQVAAFVRRVAGDRPLPPALVEQIVARTDGVPLFVEELSKAVLGSALVEERDGHYELTAPLPALAIPETLQDSLMARLDRLSGVKEVAQLGAVLGREFDYEILHAVSRLDEGALQQSLVQLVEAGLIYQRGLPPAASYVFKHALIQDAAYQSLLRSRRQEYHRQIARVLEERFPEAVETQPELLAHHYTEAGLIEEAVGWWQRAGERAVARSANAEAVAHPERGLALISALPESTDRDRRELGLRVVLAACLMALKGFTAPEIAAIHARARVLCERLDDTPILVWVLCGMFSYETVSGRLRVARSPAEQCLQSALASADPHLAVAGHLPLGASQHYMGEQAAACAQFKRVLALFDPARDASYMVTIGFDLGVLAGLFLAFVWWLRGYPDQAVATRDQAVARGRELNHAYSFGYALYSDARLSGLRGEWQRAEEIAEECIAFSSTNNLPSWVAYGRLIRGWSLTERGRREEGIEQMRAAMGHWHSLGSALHIPDFSSLLAGALLRAGQMAEARELLEQALRVIETSGETMDEAELYRLRGEVLLATDLSAAEGDFLKAIDIARAQEVKSLELRASTSLARLWQGQGKRKEAQMMLAAIYGWFTEGFGTADLLDAKALLETLTIV